MTTTLPTPPAAPPITVVTPTPPDDHVRSGDLPVVDVPPGQPRWVLPAVVALLVATAIAYLWDLNSSGYGNSFYAAAVQAGTKSWKAFFFGSVDSSNFITVDKSPGSLWVMELSGRVFGFSSWSMLVPQVLEGVAAVGLVYAAVKRWFGPAAGLVAGAALACTPVAALMFRFNNPDAFMVLLLVAAAYTLIRALEKAGTKWIVATGALIGFAFLAKMLQSFTVLPAFAGVYLLAGPTRLRRRIAQLGAMGLAIVVSAGWWVAIVALWPASSRPFIDGSPDNSILNLIFGYNGLQRLSGGTGAGGGFSGTTGVFRLFNDLMGGQASWLLPAALLSLAAGVVVRWRAPRTDRVRAAFLLWGGWLLVTGAVFSFSSGVIHTYYTVALAPAIAALVGMGGALLWQHRSHLAARVLGAVAIIGTAVWAFELLGRTPDYVSWLRWSILLVGLVAGVLLLAAPALPTVRSRMTGVALALGMVAALSGPIAYTATTITTPHTGSLPSAGPTVTAATGFGGPGGVGGGATGGTGAPGGLTSGAPGGAGRSGARPSGTGTPPSGSGSSTGRPTGGFPSGAPSSSTGGTGAAAAGSTTRPTGAAGLGSRSGTTGGAGAGPGGATTSAALTAALQKDASSYRWVAATFGSTSAASLELASNEPVMAIGGFNGEGGNLTLAAFESYVAKGEIHYFIATGGGGGGPGGNRNADAAITSWVEAHFAHRTIGGQTVYDLTTRA